jgi:signal transduction histidine kinase
MRLFLCAYLLVSQVAICFGQIPSNKLRLWLKADAGVEIKDDKVIEWRDQSGNNLHAHTKTFTPPSLIYDNERKINAIRFNGTDNGMETLPFTSFPNKAGTVIVVSRINGKSFTSGIGAGTLVSTYHGNGNTWQVAATVDKYSFYDGIGRQGYFNAKSYSTEWRVLTILRETDSTIQFMFDGNHEFTHLIENLQPSANTLKIGNNAWQKQPQDSVTEVLNGDIAEIIIYDIPLPPGMLAAVNTYLFKKYSFPSPPPPFYKTFWFYLILALLGFTSTLAIMKIISQRKLEKQLREMFLQQKIDNERHRISREMHDDIGAGLTQIILMSEAATKNNTPGRELTQITTTSRKLISSISEIIWSLEADNKTLQEMIYYQREQLNNLLEYAGFDYSIELPEDGADIVLTNEQTRTILLVTKEVVNNSIKHSGGTSIRVKASLALPILRFEISDDGCGFDINKAVHGNGLKNIQHRAERLDGQWAIITKPGDGFRFEWDIRLRTT